MTQMVQIDAHAARSVAGRIRQGLRDYLSTLALVKRAWDEEHWRVLGYDSWQDYCDGEFGAERLGLPTEHRDKALHDLRLSGMSVRAIAATTGVPKSTVADELSRLSGAGQLDKPDVVRSLDGRERPSTRPISSIGPVAVPAASSGADRSGPKPGEVEPERRNLSQSNAMDGATSPVDRPDASLVAPVVDIGSRASEPQGPSRHLTPPPAADAPEIDRYIDTDPTLIRLELRNRFLSAKARAREITKFDPADVADVLEGDIEWNDMRWLRKALNDWFDQVQAARPKSGLRVINGGSA